MTSNPSTRHPVRIGLITNPHSRRNRSQLAAIEAIVANHPGIHHRITQSEQDIPQVLQDFARLGVDAVAINGGDGTTAQVFSVLIGQQPFASLPSVILLPGGTTNMNAGDVGMRGRLKQAVRRMADWASTGHGRIRHINRPVLRAEGALDGRVAYGMFFGAGTIIRGIEYCHDKVHTVGITDELGPGVVMLRTIWGIARREAYFSTPTPMRLAFDGTDDTQTREVVLLLITSLERLFLGMHPWWGDETAAMHCTWVQKPTHRVLRAFPSLVRGKPNRHATPENGYHSHNADRIQLWIDGTFTLDGDMYHASTEQGPVTVSNGADIDFIRIG